MLALQRLSRASEQTDLVPVQRRCAAARCGLHEMVHPQLADDGRVLPAVLRRRQLEPLDAEQRDAEAPHEPAVLLQLLPTQLAPPIDGFPVRLFEHLGHEHALHGQEADGDAERVHLVQHLVVEHAGARHVPLEQVIDEDGVDKRPGVRHSDRGGGPPSPHTWSDRHRPPCHGAAPGAVTR